MKSIKNIKNIRKESRSSKNLDNWSKRSKDTFSSSNSLSEDSTESFLNLILRKEDSYPIQAPWKNRVKKP